MALDQRLKTLIDKLNIDQIEELRRLIECEFNEDDVVLSPSNVKVYSKLIDEVADANSIDAELSIVDDFTEYVNSK